MTNEEGVNMIVCFRVREMINTFRVIPRSTLINGNIATNLEYESVAAILEDWHAKLYKKIVNSLEETN
jgi:hypothetical protein